MSQAVPPRETFHFSAYAWDITAAKAFAEGREPTGAVTPTVWAGISALVTVDHDHAMTVNLDIPLIAVPAPDDAGLFIIDGWHRLRRALVEGVGQLQAVILTAAEEYQIRIYGGDKGLPYRR